VLGFQGVKRTEGDGARAERRRKVIFWSRLRFPIDLLLSSPVGPEHFLTRKHFYPVSYPPAKGSV